MRWVSTTVFLSLKQNFMRIVCSLKSAIYASLKISNHYNTTLQKRMKLWNAASRLRGCWYTNSKRILLVQSSGDRPYYNRFPRGIKIPRTFGYTS
jgi:AAA15 family ATPase/GTPase